MRYDYIEAVKEDVKKYIGENYNRKAITDEEKEELYDELFIADEVTGNGSGSYAFSTYKAEENLTHNFNLLVEACDEFGEDVGEAIRKGAEYCDVAIRCYLLRSVLDDAFD